MALSKGKLTVFIIIICVIIVWAVYLFQMLFAKNIDPVLARSKGSPKAGLQIVEFIDFQCPACAGGSILLRNYFKQYPDQIHLQIKYFPLVRMHTHALKSTYYSECAGRQGKFWEFHDLLMDRQQEWSPLLNGEGVFNDIAGRIKLNLDALKACVASDDTRTVVFDEKAQGESLGIKSTPTYFINGKMLVGTKSLTEEIDAYFSKKSN